MDLLKAEVRHGAWEVWIDIFTIDFTRVQGVLNRHIYQ